MNTGSRRHRAGAGCPDEASGTGRHPSCRPGGRGDGTSRGDDVTTLTRGVSGLSAAGALALHGDRTDPAALRAALGDAEWDAVIDTWSGAPAVVSDSAT